MDFAPVSLLRRGALRHAYRSGSRYYGEARDHKDIPLQFSSPLAAPTAWVSIPAELWIAENIFIEMSQLKVEDDVAKKLYNVEGPDKDYFLFTFEADLIPKAVLLHQLNTVSIRSCPNTYGLPL